MVDVDGSKIGAQCRNCLQLCPVFTHQIWFKYLWLCCVVFVFIVAALPIYCSL